MAEPAGDPRVPGGEQAARGRHPIQVVAGRTGLGLERIRQWERRYGVVTPERTEGGHRLYSDQDVERLRLLARAIAAGRRISDIAAMSDADLEGLVREDSMERESAADATDDEATAEFIDACMERVNRLDGVELEALLRRWASTRGVTDFVLRAVGPLLDRIGADWQAGTIRASQEHLASAVLRTVLMELASMAGGPERHPRIVVATPQGAVHELGALMIAALASAEGWAVTYLGPDLPGKDVAWVASESSARAVALSIVHPAGDPGVADELRNLLEELPKDVSLIVGGRASSSYEAALRDPRATRGGLAQFVEVLRSIR